MTGFDLIVRIFGLLLGFSIAEVLGGFARTLRLKLGLTPVSAASTRVGWLVPLLGLLVVMDQMSFWLAFYVLQAHIPLSYLTVLATLAVIGGFYLASTIGLPPSGGPAPFLIHDGSRRHGWCGRRSGSGWRSRPLRHLGGWRTIAQR